KAARKGVASYGQAPCRGGRPRPKPLAGVVDLDQDQGPLQRGCQLWPGQPTRAVDHCQPTARPWLAYDRGCPQGAITLACKGVACKGVACGQKLPLARATAHRYARKGGAYSGADHGRDADRKGNSARPLAERLSVGKGSCRQRRGSDDDGVEGARGVTAGPMMSWQEITSHVDTTIKRNR
ncbi:hypothetical protein B296_00052219, partial [Ensete ventricosum]